MAELLQELEMEIETISMVPSEGGKFEISVDGKLIFSKKQLGRHANPGEVLGLVRNYLRERS